ncbi:MAG: nucleotide sugar dehydrogenase [Prochlorococcus marinus XMU1422]|nr:nucleotide sugar dehydrogenase [Prochlorococcus marinus XMU1421]MBO7013240.1 nucleotide sugar dehydrogenase [Prochlorococcus marinus XMU1422]MCR8542305.1 nucleotide sugar dehydrogenase [Prochlorococcus marinus XMU1423]
MTKKIQKICCIGAGFVGGPTMAVIADKCPNIIVNVVDINKERIKRWNDKDLEKLPIFEPGLKEIIKRCRNKNLFFSSSVEEQLSCADMVFISVNTPTKEKGIGAGQASDLKWVEISAREISKFAKSGTIVVEKSTLPVKTAQTINNILKYSKSKKDNSNLEKKFTVLSNPEFLAEGTAINDLVNPDRILIGGEDNDAINSLKDLYLNWVDKEKILTTNLWSSELSKLIANALLAQRISSINSFSALCEATDADIKDVSLAVGLDKRIGKYFLNAGPGFGGSCFKKDILNLIYICNHYGLNEVSAYWQKVLDVNDWQQKRIRTIIVDKLFGTISGKKLAIFGFAFKANTNDTRESPSKNICLELLEEGAHLSIYDPQVMNHQIAADLNMVESKLFSSNSESGEWKKALSQEDAVKDSDAIIILTEWEEFKTIDWDLYATLMRSPSWVFDTRYICNLKKAKDSGFNVWCVGYGK